MKDPEDVKYNNEKITRKPLVLEHKLLQESSSILGITGIS